MVDEMMWWRRKRYESVQILRLEPGDWLIFTAHDKLTRASAEALREQLRETFPDHKTVVSQEMDVSVIRRPPEEPVLFRPDDDFDDYIEKGFPA